ncbi:TRAP transporter large permease subunit [Roseovarius sp. SYSU LYC5161]|uniref:TRAP transporter large permease subunit n=1 Tax=Roseovarius halophilus (ex Wu et al. 2025) TaxID=3376060 RepID=UPI00399BFE47
MTAEYLDLLMFAALMAAILSGVPVSFAYFGWATRVMQLNLPGALVPGLTLVGIYILYVLARGMIRPQDMPPAPTPESGPNWRELAGAVVPPVVLIVAVLGAILMAGVFSLAFVGLGGEARVAQILGSMSGGATGALIFAVVLIFVRGFFLDFVEITVILLPLLAPVLILMGHDPVWLAILIAINLQTSFLTPPFGFSLFYLRGAAPPEITTGQTYAGVAPFILLQAVGIAVISFLPGLATCLPSAVF